MTMPVALSLAATVAALDAAAPAGAAPVSAWLHHHDFVVSILSAALAARPTDPDAPATRAVLDAARDEAEALRERVAA
ncbi:hypothetical protein [Actinosynnema pretiosum]|uniref:Uncharacterized protein n=1 Tax=Actinosynnema pretiosum TaxID=42197 RepID=A0A290Z3K6_9PSEU|nr:hypothetical protein [Actinosynnema pretiosum]ATE53610.1 hypothetical protein CNX65_10165 [Actinosynnema pretiosum]